MGQGAMHLLFAYTGSQYFIYDCLQAVTPQIIQNTRPTIVDSHFQHGAGRVSQSVLPIEEAIDSFITSCKQTALRLSMTHNQ
jgi:hypothetical protein